MSNRRKRFQRIIILGSGLAFLGSTGFILIEALSNSPQQPAPTKTANSTPAQLAEREQGYELVLKREPENPAALQGLVETRIQMDDLAGAIEPMEKLVEIYPEQPELKALLEALKQQADSQGDGTSDR